MKKHLKMTAFSLVLLCGAVVLVGVLLQKRKQARAPHTRRPNVILISLDTVRPDHLGCYGYAARTSPNLDAFARCSVLFRNARAQAPWTLPSHMSLFTSMLPSHNRVEDINERLADDIPTLAEVLRKAGYNTAAFVNNGQMRAHWGLSRGFDLWREFPADRPEGNCESITRATLDWLEAPPRRPFFLFLHYFDAHDPYDPPPRYREQFHTTVFGEEARQIVWQHRLPGTDIKDERLMREIIGAYDGEIAWLDSELGKLLAALPSDAVTVIFSDHGEAFEEHGWTTHGAALYEEEVRVALMIHAPGVAAHEIETPVMLLDVAPTILSRCNVEAPPSFEGTPWECLQPPSRPIPSETKRFLEGRVLKSVVVGEWKLIYSLFDGAVELYKLPDEKTNLADREPARVKELLPIVQEWMEREDYWMFHAKGPGEMRATLTREDGRFIVFIPVRFDLEHDRLEPSADGKKLVWTVHPGDLTKSLYVERPPGTGPFTYDLSIDGRPKDPFVEHWGVFDFYDMPWPPLGEDETESPFLTAPPRVEGDSGFYVIHHLGKESDKARQPSGVKLDKETIEQLRSLGYVQ